MSLQWLVIGHLGGVGGEGLLVRVAGAAEVGDGVAVYGLFRSGH